MIARILRTVVVLELLWAVAIASWLAAEFDWSLGLAIAAGVAAPLAVHAGIIALDFGIATIAGSPTPPQHRIGLFASLIVYVRVYLREVIDSIAVFQWAQPWLRGRPLAGEHVGAGTSARVPVVLVHGYFCNRQVWRPFAAWLAARGHAIEAVDLEPAFGSIDAYAPIIAAAVARLRERTGAQRVAIVGHSMGGLAVRAYLRAEGDSMVGNVVTLGTPHRGTVLARVGQGANARQMRRDSRWLRTLAEGETQALRARFTVVLSHHDNIVVPQAIQTLAGARNIEVSGFGHLSLALAPRIWETVAAAIDDAANPRR